MFEVVYCSGCGNTKNIAGAIAAELGIEAEDVKTKKELAKDSLVFFGSSCRSGKPRRNCLSLDFIKENDFEGKKVAQFLASGGGSSDGVRAVEEMLSSAGAVIKGSLYFRGSWFPLFDRKQPSDEELISTREFVNKMKES